MDKTQITDLLREFNYPAHLAENTIEKIHNLHPEIAAAFENWCQTRNVPDVEIEGYSFSCLVNDYKMKPIGAFITLDWLKKDPDSALIALKRGIM